MMEIGDRFLSLTGGLSRYRVLREGGTMVVARSKVLVEVNDLRDLGKGVVSP